MAVSRLVHSADNEERLRNQGVAQTMIAILGLPATLEAELVAEQFRAAMQIPTGNGKMPLDGMPQVEEY